MEKYQAIVWVPVIGIATFFAVLGWDFFAVVVIVIGLLLTEADYPPHSDLKETNWDDKEWVKWALSKDAHNYKYVDSSLQTDKDIIFFALKKDSYIYNYLPDYLKHENFIKEILKKKINISPLLNNKEFILYAIKHGHAYTAFFCASEELQNDPSIISKALESDPNVLMQLDEDMKDDKENAIKVVSKNGENLEHMHENMKNDKDVVLAAIDQDVDAYRFASESLKYDDKVIKAAIFSDENRSGFYIFPKDLRSNKKIVVMAMQKNSYNLYYASPELRRDKDLKRLYKEANDYSYTEENRKRWMQDAHSFHRTWSRLNHEDYK
ncbi:DUF4116 domain-containing protein [Pseudomonadota bacterium]|nr:DUF4116 domain-containing protein [Pseudomonadota bacterium]